MRNLRKLLRLAKFTTPYGSRMGVGILCVILVALSGLVMPQIIAFVLDVILSPRPAGERVLGIPIYIVSLQDRILWLNIILIFVVVLYVARGALSYMRSYLMSWVGERVLFDMRHSVFQKLQDLPMQFYQSRGRGASCPASREMWT